MKINIFPIASSLHSNDVISKNTLMLLEELKSLSNYEFNIVNIDSLYDADLSLILIQSGGSEQLILENFDKLVGEIKELVPADIYDDCNKQIVLRNFSKYESYDYFSSTVRTVNPDGSVDTYSTFNLSDYFNN